jgi:hypothetical protein
VSVSGSAAKRFGFLNPFHICDIPPGSPAASPQTIQR